MAFLATQFFAKPQQGYSMQCQTMDSEGIAKAKPAHLATTTVCVEWPPATGCAWTVRRYWNDYIICEKISDADRCECEIDADS